MTIKDIFRLRETRGAVGVEVEIEGEQLPRNLRMDDWKIEHDGSLRGEAFEYVFRGPVDVEDAFRRLGDLEQAFKDNGSTVIDSGRAGVHVHVNVQDLTPKQVACFISLYYIFENILLEFCGEDRIGNLFCLRTCDAEGAIPLITQAFNHDKLRGLGTDEIRYAALNLNSLPKYGSVEFRSMRSNGDLDLVRKWVTMLLRMKEYALGYDDPRAIVEGMSGMDTRVMFHDVFGGDTPLNYDEDSMYEGVRYAQDFAYGVDWDRPDINELLIQEGYAVAEGDV